VNNWFLKPLLSHATCTAYSEDFHVDVPYPQLCELLGGASAGLHTMLDEHFGICVVVYRGAGAVPIAHDSAGPRMDIVRPANGEEHSVGYLATTEEEYAAAMGEVLGMEDGAREAMAARGRERSAMFSEEAFGKGLRDALSPLLRGMKAGERRRKVERGRELAERVMAAKMKPQA
jgi:alpha-1,2-mannosyltransferase